MRKILRWFISTLVMFFAVLFVLVGLLNRFSAPEGRGLFGYKGYIVTSNSMQPAFSAGDCIVDKLEPFSSLQENDVITFLDGETIVTHRVVKKTAEGIQTKGDANNTADMKMVEEAEYIGKMKYIFAGLGSVIIFLQRPIVFPVLIFLVGAYIIYLYYTAPEEESSVEAQME